MSRTHKQDGADHPSSLAPSASHSTLDSISQTLYIVVNRGDPIDSYSMRHTAFWVEFSDGRNLLSHVCGAASFFEFEERWNEAQPQEGKNFERIIFVLTVRTAVDDMTIRNTLRQTPVNNKERSWNCQTWIGDGLQRLQDAKLLREANTVSAADQMVDVLLEAPDEE
ncbi:hypothetical protein VE03_00039 [Pseudogymnoascus sp. 23342-1-I1]|nr:hypothetical protein VE03_00039 [Pseudogymnoascus sp. 23342-1-I1]